MLFLQWHIFDDIKITYLYPLWYVALRMEITYGNYVSFLFVIVTYFLLRHNYVIYLFDVVTFFDNVRITLYFGTFELRMEITLQLRFVFARHCDVFFITSQLRYLFVHCSYVFWWRENYVIFWFVWITYGNNVTITFRLCWSLWRIFYYVTITLFICSLKLRFLMTLQLHYILVRSNYVLKLRFKMVIF